MINFPCLDTCTSFVEVKAARNKIPTGARLCCKAGQTIYSEDDDLILIFRGDANIQAGWRGFTARFRYCECSSLQQEVVKHEKVKLRF
ncbi:unnamed protein product [Strongylus vulgaris]|uniref:CUB domain-containing protein n=1 Tax=Strongylus vulgaris TaxID=40348 RepID=A0A3P7JZE3_STRVU|nr:unnamed protein product [Strongylus vulgaris]